MYSTCSAITPSASVLELQRSWAGGPGTGDFASVGLKPVAVKQTLGPTVVSWKTAARDGALCPSTCAVALAL